MKAHRHIEYRTGHHKVKKQQTEQPSLRTVHVFYHSEIRAERLHGLTASPDFIAVQVISQ